MITSIHIENIKGIQDKKFNLNMIPNKPSLLVAPNGFGKSSIATAFKSMNNHRILLEEDDFFEGNTTNLPKIEIEYKDINGADINLIATSDKNKISEVFDCFVINNQLIPKGIGSQYGRASARLEIKDIVLVDKVPESIKFSYKYTDFRKRFGLCGRVLPNANYILSNFIFIEKLSQNYSTLEKANGDRIQKRINNIINKINSQNGTADVLNEWVAVNQLHNLQGIVPLNVIASLVRKIGDENNTEIISYLIAIQLIWLYNNDPNEFKKVCKYHSYLLEKQRFDETLSTFNRTWKNIRAVQKGGKLIVKFPEAIYISNGQRDILTFISMLFRAQKHLKKDANILIIDEVFDYLDDANLIAAQYYITKMIKQYKKEGKVIYPIILTHIDPNYFKNFAFKDQKVYYLDKPNITPNNDFVKLLKTRNDSEIKEYVSKYLLHYCPPDGTNGKDILHNFGLNEDWGEPNNFYKFLFTHLDNYLKNKSFCPLAVCGAVRIKIERDIYNKLKSDEAKAQFVNTHKTREKLDKAEETGIICPESYYLLGIIYNEALHFRDNIAPISAKLENITIKQLIMNIP